MIITEWKAQSDPLYIWSREGDLMLGLQWSRTPPLKLLWTGPDKISVTANPDTTGQRAIAAIIGPPGPQGEKGRDGKDGDPGDRGDRGLDGNLIVPESLDGGNF